MKYLYLLILLLFNSFAMADFLDAVEAYEIKNYSQALKEYQTIAKLGHHEAQHNLAVMYFLGQGTKKNPIQAYAWATLAKASDDTKLQSLQDNIKQKLNAEQLGEAQQQAQSLQQQYGSDAVDKLWAPPSTLIDSPFKQDNEKTESSDYTLTPIKRKAPRYPKSALEKGIQGWVKVTFEVHPDGTTRRPVVVDSFPQDTFDEATLRAIRGFKFDVDFAPGIKPYPVCATQNISYEMGHQKPYKKGYQERIEKLQNLAENGHPDAHYYLAMAMDGRSPIPESTDWERSQLLINQHFFKAAQNGHLNAQYQLGNNLYSGVGGYQDRDKGIRWLMLAAENGQAQAARRLSQIFKANPEMNKTQHPAQYWMVQAAESGDLDAKLNYAEWLANNGNSPEQFQHGLTLLDDYADDRPETVLWYQTAASLHTKTGNENKAEKFRKKADKLAKKLGWKI
jgi:TonB family C-terminal domain